MSNESAPDTGLNTRQREAAEYLRRRRYVFARTPNGLLCGTNNRSAIEIPWPGPLPVPTWPVQINVPARLADRRWWKAMQYAEPVCTWKLVLPDPPEACSACGCPGTQGPLFEGSPPFDYGVVREALIAFPLGRVEVRWAGISGGIVAYFVHSRYRRFRSSAASLGEYRRPIIAMGRR